MKHVFALTKRNILLFLRDKLSVFFSFMSTIILVLLYFLFIAKSYTSGILDQTELPSKDANFLVYLQMMAGVLILNSMSLTIGVFSTVAKDFETRRIDNFFTTPVSVSGLLLSYLSAAFIVSFALNVFTWIGSALLIGILTGYFVSFGTVMMGIVILVFASVVSCAIMLLVTTLVRSSTAMGVIGGIAGTFFGFLCGIYMPYSGLGKTTEAVGSCLPYTHLTIWMKQTLLSDAFSKLSLTEEGKDMLMGEFFSAKNIGFCGFDVSLPVMLVFCGVFALICRALAWYLLNKRIVKRQTGSK